MKKEILPYKVLFIAFISTPSFCSIDVSKPDDVFIKKKEIGNQLKKIKQLAKTRIVVRMLAEDPFKDFDYVRPDFYKIYSVK